MYPPFLTDENTLDSAFSRLRQVVDELVAAGPYFDDADRHIRMN